MNKKISAETMEATMIKMMMDSLNDIYGNKSSDEYKTCGNITLSPEYDSIDLMVSDLPKLIKFPKSDASDLKSLFLTLHRPIFKKMVSEYIHEPNEKNTIFTAVYTVGYRVLVGELSRIYASTSATDKGIVYKPDKISKRNDMVPFIRTFNSNIEERINSYLRSMKTNADSKIVTEGFIVDIPSIIDGFGRLVKTVFAVTKLAFNGLASIDSILSRGYSFNVKKASTIAKLYKETKIAYEEYMQIPEKDRKAKTESKYIKMLKRYEIAMDNAAAAIKHYDSRAEEKVKDEMNKIDTSASSSGNKDTSKSTTVPSDLDY